MALLVITVLFTCFINFRLTSKRVDLQYCKELKLSVVPNFITMSTTRTGNFSIQVLIPTKCGQRGKPYFCKLLTNIIWRKLSTLDLKVVCGLLLV